MKSQVYKINGTRYEVCIDSMTGKNAEVIVNGIRYNVEIEGDGDIYPRPAKSVYAPLPGVILEIKVTEGQHINEGDTIAVIEAMKMENEIQSEYDGTVVEVNVQEGDFVKQGSLLISLK